MELHLSHSLLLFSSVPLPLASHSLSSFMWNDYISMSGMLKCTSKALLHVVLNHEIVLQFPVLKMSRNGLCLCA